MEQTVRTPRNTAGRNPLTERQPRVRQSSVHSKASEYSKGASSTPIPHHESLYPENNLSVITKSQPPSVLAGNKRVIAIAEDETATNKRASQISNASTISTTKGKRKTHIGPWQLGKTLGKGATGRVRLAKHAFTGQTAAIKIVSKKSAAMVQSASMAQMDNDTTLHGNIGGTRTVPFGIEREIVIMKLIEHPNIISLYDVWENRGELYLVLEYVEGGELFDYVMRNGALPESEAVRLLRQLIGGLSYCHRFNICHRDLKPENLLLDQDHNIKIADFGMAALQPNGKYLTTSCGSPHYAAPEIIKGKQYRGDVADIWSLGIILYAMLNGFLPFDGGDLPSTLRKVRSGKYYLSPELSPEATDLIQGMLQQRPECRITMDEMWKHPLLSKYEKIHATLAAPHKLVGPPPPLTAADCGPQRIRRSDIDRELLRNLQILWHGLEEEEVIRRLTSDEPNHEKLFYWSLVKFRQEQLENYCGDPLQYSASDYHHVRKPVQRLPRVTTKTALHQRKHSQFSIVSEGSITREAYYKNPTIAASKTTQSSYDPYRASRTPITHAQKQETTVVVRDPGSSSSAQRMPSGSLPHGLLDSPVSSVLAVPSSASQDLQRLIREKRTTYSTVSSQSSLASSQRHRTFRKSTSYRRNVIFQHQPQRSGHTSSASKYSSDKPSLSKTGEDNRPPTQQSNQPFPDSYSTPSLPTPSNQVLRPKRPASDLDLHTTRVAATPWKDDTRIVSAELSKICEEAFNRSSVSYASDISQQLPVDSPATTVSVPQAVLLNHGKGRARQLTPALRDLVERRQKIIETWGDADPKTLADLVEMLDKRITKERENSEAATDRRAASEPVKSTYPTTAETSSTLDGIRNFKRDWNKDARAVSDPVNNHDRTIRMVTPDPLSPIARLEPRISKTMPLNSLKGGSYHALGFNRNPSNHDKRLLGGQFLEPILEDPCKSPSKAGFADSKKWSWLGRKATNSSDDLPPMPPKKDTPKDKQPRTYSSLSTTSSTDAQQEDMTTEETIAKKRHWFQKMFGKHREDHTVSAANEHTVVLNNMDDHGSVEDYDLPSHTSTGHGHRYRPSMEGVAVSSANVQPESSQNWFAKFLHLKPATSVLVFHASKARARKEVL